jgi:hypothetical protein
MARPTEEAKFQFAQVEKWASKAQSSYGQPGAKSPDTIRANREAMRALIAMAWGLSHLSDGLRATYILLEQVNSKLDSR